MKNIILLTILTLLLTQLSFGQSAGVTIGDSNETTDGTIRYKTTTGFEGLHLGNWMPFSDNNTGTTLWSLNGSSAYYNGGFVGIGTNVPATQLHVIGAGKFIGPGSSTGEVSISSPAGQPGIIMRSNAPNNYRADIRRSIASLDFSASAADGGPIVPQVVLMNNGRVGIGTTNPVSLLDVNNSFFGGTGLIAIRPQNSGIEGGELLMLGSTGNNDYRIDNNSGKLRFFHDGAVAMEITDDYKVTVGPVTSTPGAYKLYVSTGILTERVKIATVGSADWADYVFEEDYELKSLNEIKQFVQKNKHLPNVPSAKDVEKNGYELQQMDAKLLEKIEELYLLTIQLNEEKQLMESINEKLISENIKLRATQEDILRRLAELEK